MKYEAKEQYTIMDISKATGIRDVDIIDALEKCKLLKKQHNQIYLCTDPTILENVYKSYGRPSIPIDPMRLHWWPFKIRYDEQDNVHK